jgi:hypothetical protein
MLLFFEKWQHCQAQSYDLLNLDQLEVTLN